LNHSKKLEKIKSQPINIKQKTKPMEKIIKITSQNHDKAHKFKEKEELKE
jgi:hypothetical protein